MKHELIGITECIKGIPPKQLHRSPLEREGKGIFAWHDLAVCGPMNVSVASHGPFQVPLMPFRAHSLCFPTFCEYKTALVSRRRRLDKVMKKCRHRLVRDGETHAEMREPVLPKSSIGESVPPHKLQNACNCFTMLSVQGFWGLTASSFPIGLGSLILLNDVVRDTSDFNMA